MKTIDISGQRFGRLTAVERVTSIGKAIWRCVCDCGGVAFIGANALRTGNSKSCGCQKYAGLRRYTEERRGRSVWRLHKRAYNTWAHMISRCGNPEDPYYSYYGGRGIKVAVRWLRLENFVADMGDPPEGMSLDRIDGTGDYVPDNCRWATPKQQARNTRSNVFVVLRGERITVAEASERTGIPAPTLYSRAARVRGMLTVVAEPKLRGNPQ